MADVVKHAWTHRPRAQGGTDPIEIPSDLKWATITAFDFGNTPDDGYYTPHFDVLGTNDSSAFELADISAGKAAHLQLNTPGYYHALFGVTITSGGGWGANDSQIEPYVIISAAPSQLDTEVNSESDWIQSQFAPGAYLVSGESTTHTSLWRHDTFHWNPGDGSNLGFEDPLLLGVRVLTTLSGEKTLTAQIHVHRIAGPGFTVTEADP